MSDYSVSDLLVRTRLGEGEQTTTDMVIIGRSAMLDGGFSIMEGFLEPRAIIAPHLHEKEAQAIFIIEGTVDVEVGGEAGLHFSASAGDYVLKPKGTEHTFWNPSDTVTVHYIELSSRDGFEKFVDARARGVVYQQIKAKLALGISTNYPRTAQLMQEHGLTKLAGINLYGADADEG